MTIQKLKNAFWELYKKKAISKITVMDITSLAGVHRSTFYLYFKDVYHVLECIEDDITDYFEKHIIRAVPINTADELVRAFSDFYSEKGEYMYILTGADGDPKFVNKLSNIVIPELYHQGIISDDDDTLSEIKINFLIGWYLIRAFGMVCEAR